MLAEHGAPGDQFVARDRDRALDFRAPLVGSRDLALDLGDLGEYGRAILDRERLGDDELAGNAKEAVEHAWPTIGRIFPDGDDSAKPGILFAGAPPFHRLPAKGDAHSGEIPVQPHARQQHRYGEARVQQSAEEFAGLGIDRPVTRHDLQHPCAIGGEVVDEIGSCFRQLLQRLLVHVLDRDAGSFPKPTRHIVSEPDLALKPSADDGEIEVVDKHSLVAEPLAVFAVDHARERILECSADFGLHLAPDDVGIDGEAAIVHRAD